ncbi:MAG: alpha/beta fold hydrolase [Lachnospiraceae bacterium]|nr:alpha/beta fold hydrolase [Lachnospiraceae bacterium]MCI9283922.1 alpha/beta fold hydrolase [Lachnospiraceae bacterium]
MRRIRMMALGISLLSALCACGNVESEKSMVEAIPSESIEMEYQSEKDSSQIYQEEQETAVALEYETREIHVDKEGMDIYGVVHIPSGRQGKMPAVIISHELGATLDRVKGYGEALAEEGYVTVCFDFCGGGWGSRSDGELLDMSVLTEKADLEAVLHEVKQWDFVDADSIYLMGNSQGGLVTALTASEHRDEIRAVILIYPAFSLYDDVHRMFDSPEEIPETHSLLGLRLGNRYFVDIWDQEPYERIKEFGKNILLIHGDRDSIIPVSYSDKLAETVDHVEYHVIQGADHGYLGENFELAVSYIRDFLNKEQNEDKKEVSK